MVPPGFMHLCASPLRPYNGGQPLWIGTDSEVVFNPVELPYRHSQPTGDDSLEHSGDTSPDKMTSSSAFLHVYHSILYKVCQ
ncbi:MAG: hypothetical protein K2I93_07915 [Oscillospiraceae bacterium]|nr:hypothetical protein [Oscillospiraceae bacterium]